MSMQPQASGPGSVHPWGHTVAFSPRGHSNFILNLWVEIKKKKMSLWNFWWKLLAVSAPEEGPLRCLS